MSSVRFIAAIIAGLTATSALAYLTPTEVFPDLEVQEAPAEQDAQEQSPPNNEPAEEPGSMQMEGSTTGKQNPFEAQEPTPQAKPQQQRVQPSSSAAPEPSNNSGKPTFYRSGEQIVPQQEPTPETPPIEETIFEQENSSEPMEEEFVEPEPEQLEPLEEPQEPEAEPMKQEVEQELQEAAPSTSIIGALMGQMQYLIAIVGLGLAGIVFLVLKLKGKAKAKATAEVPQAPEQTLVDESSSKLSEAISGPEKE